MTQDEFEQTLGALRQELKADFAATEGALTALGNGMETLAGESREAAHRVEQVSEKLEELGGKFEELSGKFEELSGKFEELSGKFEELTGHVRRLGMESMQQTHRFDQLAGDLAEEGRQWQGRMRQQAGRLESIFNAVDARFKTMDRDTGRQLADLRQRVARLEEQQGPPPPGGPSVAA